MFFTAHRYKERTRAGAALLPVLLIILSLLFACGRKSDSTLRPPAFPGDLVAASEAGSLDANFLNAAIATLGLSGLTVTSGTTCYKLTYGTPDVSGSLINASGLVCLPAAGSGGHPIISYQHGTIFQDRDAPSSFITSPEALLGAVLAGLGFIAVLPDYIGYGVSTAKLHPYLHAATLSSATVDMNRAARTFLAQSGVSGNGRFFLTGYSEGGYATLATQRLMEQSLAAEFPVTASEPGAGPYDMTGTARHFLGLPAQPQPAFTGFVLKAYDSVYNTTSQLTHYFSATYASAADAVFDGRFNRNEISTALGGRGVATNALFNPVFLSSYLGAGEAELKARFAENDVYNWKPTVPTRLFHGVDDETVPYANATTAKTAMDANGSTAVTVINCNAGASPADHDSCVQPFAQDMITFFRSLAAQ